MLPPKPHRKKVLLVLGVLILIITVMPSASAKFTGQHTFISGSEVDCAKCHSRVAQELSGSDVHNFSVSGYASGACRVCHIIRLGGSLNNSYQGGTSPYHAAALIECTYCHGENAGKPTGYGTAAIPPVNVTAEFENSTLEAHIPLYMSAKYGSTDLLVGANEACIACHTHAANVTVSEGGAILIINATLTDACTPWIDPNCYPAEPATNLAWEVNLSTTI